MENFENQNTADYFAPKSDTNSPGSPAERSPFQQQAQYIQERSYTPQNDYSSYVSNSPSSSSTPISTPKPPKNDKKNVTLGTVFLSSAATAVITSIMTCVIAFAFGAGGFALLFSSDENSNPNSVVSTAEGETTKNIIIDSTAETAAVAVAEKVSPSVVGITVSSTTYNYFFGSSESQSQGSGIIYTADGYIITNYHVVEAAVTNAGKINVYINKDLETGISATVIGYDVSADLAVIKIEKTGLTPIEIGDSDRLEVGQTAIAIGNPGGLEFYGSVSMGIISGLNRKLQLESSSSITLIQTDTAINPGNSGGALTDSQGKLIGVNSAKLSGDGFEGMGFAIPVNDTKDICDRIIRGEGSSKPYFGLNLSEYYTSDILKQYGFPAGVVVESVSNGGPADKCGIQRGDIITELNSVAVTSVEEFTKERSKYTPGNTVILTVYRDKQYYSVKLTLGMANN